MSDAPMTQADALSVLALESIPDPKTLKRAYLRKVKEHPPERDPEAFSRIREAFEFLDAGRVAPIFESVVERPHEKSPSPSALPARLLASTDTPLDFASLPSSSEPPLGDPRAGLGGSLPEPHGAEFKAVLESPPEEVKASSSDLASSSDASANFASEPSHEPSFDDPLGEFEFRFARGELLEAKASLEAWFETPEKNHYLGAEILSLYFRLVAEGHFDAGTDLFASLERRLASHGDELFLFGSSKSELALARVFVREASHLEEPSRRLAAAALAPLDFDDAAARLDAIRENHPPLAYEALRRRLAIRKGLLLDVLFPPKVSEERAERGSTWSFPFFLFLVFFQLLRACVNSTSEAPGPSTSRSSAAPTSTQVERK